ncbi:MAG: hypothetical protein P0Y49_05945 [Candidatus Pedobacter colombiensis]|uniref:Uncharacterized protein n=1 Tax=Candidatus Pedobacter colombiensis TaxID=3121371 RepID=A0AAJ5WA16_9SPHI|nr:hypothetical protein [Pedobacter sp.]WEK20679.1 MAG: hypothetical protein P0Y49_05945 [Pedobacter sp.]
MMKRKFDFAFIGVLGLFMTNTIIQLVLYDNLLSINNYVGFTCFMIATALRFTNNRYRRYGLPILLLLCTFNIANLEIGNVAFFVSYGSMESISINPIILFILIIYYFVNKINVKQVVKTIFFPSAEEQEIDHQKLTDFYFRKFENCSDKELEYITRNFKDYPLAAQNALEKIHTLKDQPTKL